MKQGKSRRVVMAWLLLAAVALVVWLVLAAGPRPGRAVAAPDMMVYADGLQGGWQNWSWATVDLASHDSVHSGQSSIKVTYTAAFQGLYLHHEALDSGSFANLSFWINGGATANPALTVSGIIGTKDQASVPVDRYVEGGSNQANTWRKVTIPLNALGITRTTDFTGFWIMNGNAAQPPVYLDDITLTGRTGPPPAEARNPPVEIKIDAAANRHPISPLIYGVAYGNATTLSELNAPLNRLGGNNTSRYNWEANADNRGSDWFFESIGDDSATPGQRGDHFIQDSRAGGAQPMMTIPMIGWVAKLGPNRSKLSSYSIAKYGPQTGHDQYMPDAGNGTSTRDKKPITNNDPNDANIPADSTFQKKWFQHMAATFGKAPAGGLRYYILDNEPSIWQGTHRDVHPVGPKMEEIRDKIIDYAAMIKSVDPDGLVVAPEEWGWSGYLYSGYDQQYGAAHGWNSFPDRTAHGGLDYLPWLLDSLHKHETASGKRSIDVFTVHYYPQGGEFGNDTSQAMQLRRNRSTRSLWDPNYVDESWVHSVVQLIPRIKNWVKQYYPGLKVGLTEYNWGAEGHINGATAQADISGILGRENLDLAARWTAPDPKTPTFKAMQMYRNYDGKKSTFGDTSVSDIVPNPDNLSSFAALRTQDGALTIMVISKVLSGDTPTTLSLGNFTAGAGAQVWQLTRANTIQHLPDVPAAGGKITTTLPAQSITLFVVPPAAGRR